MANRQALLRARLETTRADLEEVLAKLGDLSLDWAPRAGMRTVGGQLLEILVTEMQHLAMLRGMPVPDYVELEQTQARETLEEYLAALHEARRQLLDWLAAASPEDLEASVSVKPEMWESGGMTAVPAAEILCWASAHEWYHTGQLVSYLWFLGKDPYDG